MDNKKQDKQSSQAMPAQRNSAEATRKRIRAWQLFVGRVFYDLVDDLDRSDLPLSENQADHVWSLYADECVGETSRAILRDERGLYEKLVKAATMYTAWAVAVRKRGQTPWRNFSRPYPLVLTKQDLNGQGDPPPLPIKSQIKSLRSRGNQKTDQLLKFKP